MRKRYVLLFVFLSFALLLCACGKIKIHRDTDTPETPQPVVETEPPPTETPAPVLINQLTGEPEEKDCSADRPFAVMINNISVAQPQVGISHADWIYEVEAEGGITRMMALFSHIEDAESIGSIRSLRPYYLSLALSYDAIMIHGGGSEDAYSDCVKYAADHLDGVRDPKALEAIFYRDSSRGANGSEHTLFLHGNKAPALSDEYQIRRNHENGYDNGLRFSDTSAALCPNASDQVKVTLTTSKTMRFTYHPETGKYTGFQYQGDYIDGGTNEAVQFSNLLILQTNMRVYDSKGHIDAELIGSGNGWFCTGGKWVEIKWSRDDIHSSFSYTTADGTPVTFTPGKTYCAIIPMRNAGVDFS